ncbi:hypothetical protein [Mameliella alba]|uniref:SnoaL-like domain-containing protein n=1 Tax=Mameliella alba TaxID=561184 RepID=A0A0B3RUR9_9RHOB|nr:hypothetical protein [Mameliella alba]KHQ50463.1 hypothetical protein OA50_04971 [Mameliella alba]
MNLSPDTAHDVAASLLAATGDALTTGDFELFRRNFRLPQAIATIGGTRTLRSDEDLRRTFDQIQAHYAEIGLHRLDRWIEVALFDGPDEIRSCHVTHMLSKSGKLLNTPILTMSRLLREGERWLIGGTQYTISAESAHGQALLSGGGPYRAQGAGGAAEAIFQNHLDRVTRAYMEDRFDLLMAAVQLPLFLQASEGAILISDIQQLQEDFSRSITRLRVQSVSDIVRRVQSAEIIGEKRIHGTYRTHILSAEQLVIPAYKSAMSIEMGTDLNWRMTSVMHPIGHMTLPDGPGDAKGYGPGERV